MSSGTFSPLPDSLDSRRVAEYHGALTGMACGGGPQPDIDWQSALAGSDAAGRADAAEALKELGAQTMRTLDDQSMNFEPLLPDDAEALDQRAKALQLWCQGFLYGFGVGFAPGESPPLPNEAREVLGDFTEIAREELAVEGTEADEAAYAEIVEYIRVGAQLVFETLHPASPNRKRLH